MSRNRYVGDYRLIDTVNERGRIKTGYEYIGSPYGFIAPREEVEKAKKIALAACLLGWAAFVGALLPLSAAARTFYVSVPFAFSALPLGMATAVILGVMRVRDAFEHRHADRLENRYPACAFFLMALSGASLIGEMINLLRGAEMLAGDLAFSLCAAALFGCGLAAFRQREKLKCRALS